jgi:hypothetical protein
VHSGVDGDTPDIMHEEGITVNVTDIGIPNGLAEDGTRGFTKGPRVDEYEARKPN